MYLIYERTEGGVAHIGDITMYWRIYDLLGHLRTLLPLPQWHTYDKLTMSEGHQLDSID